MADSQVVPQALTRRGARSVTGVRDNVPEGMAVGGIARTFALIFREEIQQRFISGEQACASKQGAAAAAEV